MLSSEVLIKARSPAASLPFKGQGTEQTTVKWSIWYILKLVNLQTCHSSAPSYKYHQIPQSTLQTNMFNRKTARPFYQVLHFRTIPALFHLICSLCWQTSVSMPIKIFFTLNIALKLSHCRLSQSTPPKKLYFSFIAGEPKIQGFCRIHPDRFGCLKAD